MCLLDDKKDSWLLWSEGGARDDIKAKASVVLHLCMWIIVPAEGGDTSSRGEDITRDNH